MINKYDGTKVVSWDLFTWLSIHGEQYNLSH